MATLGVILAGGLATRMGGGDKGLLPLGGKPVIDHVITRLSPQVEGLALNANGDAARFEHLGLPILPDEVAGHPGPLAGVLAGMNWAAAQGATHIVTAAADTPFFPLDLAGRLVGAATEQGKPIALAATKTSQKTWRQPTFGFWPVALRDDLAAVLDSGIRKIVAWTDRHGTALAIYPDAPFDPFFNINTPDDLARAEELLL